MTMDFNHEDVKFSHELGDWFDWELDDGEIALTRGGQVKLNGKVLSAELVAMANKHSSAFRDAVQKWKSEAEYLACETGERMTDEQALRELDQAQRIINKHIACGFVVDFCHDEEGFFGFSYNPERNAEIVENTA